MRTLLVAVNARFNHTNIAVRSIEGYVKKHLPACQISFGEWTINMSLQEILRGIHDCSPHMVLFSVYIWNSEVIHKLIPEVKKILPGVIVGAGGPEASFNGDDWLRKFPVLDFVVCGEGEETVLEICRDEKISEGTKGIWLRDGDRISFTGERQLICDLDELVFPYERIDDPQNRIYYYESSRGCPFSCAYCMSSLDKRVRFHSLERVFCDLKKFLSAGASLVKFVDRTYNLNEERYIAIWKFILENHNGKTMFHFEIEAEFLSERALEFLRSVPENVMQFEIGVQSCNPKTLEAVGRSAETKKLFANILKIPKTIHSHLDLIAGLPYEDLDSFGDSFQKVMELRPDVLQLGFLKVLHGTTMKFYAEKNGWQWMSNPPYEVLSTPCLGYSDILFLKDVDVLLDSLWNSGIYSASMKYLGRKFGWKNFFWKAAEEFRADESLASSRKNVWWFERLAQWLCDDRVLLELLKFDFIRMAKTSRFPSWMEHRYSKENHLAAMNEHESRFDNRIEFAFSEYDEFSVNPLAERPEETAGIFPVLFIYKRHNSEIKDTQILLEQCRN